MLQCVYLAIQTNFWHKVKFCILVVTAVVYQSAETSTIKTIRATLASYARLIVRIASTLPSAHPALPTSICYYQKQHAIQYAP